jgi:hypothetical protein
VHRVVITIAVLASMLGGSPAGASPQSDFDAVYGDWKPDLEITACRWSQAQLQNAYGVAQGNPDFQYETAFVDATKAEIDRWKNGGCAGVKPLSARQKSKLFGVKIVSVNGKGKPTSEVVKMRNAARRTISFRKARLRNSKSGAAVFPASFKLRKGRTATVHLGCAKGKRRASFNGATVWLCRRKQLFRDKGDLARLSDAKGIVVSQSGFGSLKRRPAF